MDWDSSNRLMRKMSSFYHEYNIFQLFIIKQFFCMHTIYIYIYRNLCVNLLIVRCIAAVTADSIWKKRNIQYIVFFCPLWVFRKAQSINTVKTLRWCCSLYDSDTYCAVSVLPDAKSVRVCACIIIFVFCFTSVFIRWMLWTDITKSRRIYIHTKHLPNICLCAFGSLFNTNHLVWCSPSSSSE